MSETDADQGFVVGVLTMVLVCCIAGASFLAGLHCRCEARDPSAPGSRAWEPSD